MMNIAQFSTQLYQLLDRYQQDNAWVKWWAADDIHNSWKMYKTSSNTQLGFLLLGDTKIRKDRSLLMNFGTTTANDIQEAEERRVIAEISDQRKVMSYGTQGITYQPAKGLGSILSDSRWTPMLNDSFVLGGIHSGAEFHLAEALFQAKSGRKINLSVKEKWLHFFKNNPLTFWADFGPRVFARECICLQAAGYQPVFSSLGLVFAGPAKNVSFDTLLTAITQSGLTAGNKHLAMANISRFLFDDEKVLGVA